MSEAAVLPGFSEGELEELGNLGVYILDRTELEESGEVAEPDEAIELIRSEYSRAVETAWANLARYKFSNFGYWAARVVFLGQILGKLGAGQPANPFKGLVHYARENGGAA